MRLSVVVPCYNEADNLKLILEKFKTVITRDDIEVILVDNGSTDNSAELMSDLLPGYPFARTVKVIKNQGYGFGILSGLKRARGEFIGWTHADMQTDPADVLKALSLIETADDPEETYVKGNRKGRPFFDEFFTVGMSIFETVLMGKKLWDINAQPNIFHKNFFESWNEPPHDFALDLYALYMAARRKMTIIRFDVVFPPRVHGASKWNTGLASKWKFIVRTVKFSLQLKKRLR